MVGGDHVGLLVCWFACFLGEIVSFNYDATLHVCYVVFHARGKEYVDWNKNNFVGEQVALVDGWLPILILVDVGVLVSKSVSN
jgi:hypothetical protein